MSVLRLGVSLWGEHRGVESLRNISNGLGELCANTNPAESLVRQDYLALEREQQAILSSLFSLGCDRLLLHSIQIFLLEAGFKPWVRWPVTAIPGSGGVKLTSTMGILTNQHQLFVSASYHGSKTCSLRPV